MENSRRKIGIRADGGSIIGMGHIMRTLTLSKGLSKYYDVCYICKDGEEYFKGIEKVSDDFQVIKIKKDNVIDELKNINIDMLITDSYDVDEKYFEETKRIFSLCGYIDDMNLFDFKNVDFVINQNFGSEKNNYISSGSTKFLCGGSFTMIREEFQNIKRIDIKEEIKSIVISIGGSDPMNMTLPILNMLRDFKGDIHVLIGAAFSNIDDIQSFTVEDSRIHTYVNGNVGEVFSMGDVLISAAGSTLYEASIVGIPTIALTIAENQIDLVEKMSNSNLIIPLGWYYDLNEEKLLYSLNSISNMETRKIISENQKLIKKNGVDNIVSYIRTIL